ncbi:MAG TPA: putative glycoside hydrolase [Thermodesulfobacteriota bacterium]|nr:putative glycoside hydrolase [Thermodesulfobacteriota bacterium]
MVVAVILACLVAVFSPATGQGADVPAMKVVDYFTGQPIAAAKVTAGKELMLTDAQGAFPLPKEEKKLKFRAHGYLRAEETIPASPLPNPQPVRLIPFTPKGLYLSFYGVGVRALRDPALTLIRDTELNALVIDVKGDRGMIPYKSSVALASEIGAQKIITVRDIHGLMKTFKEQGIYTIARIVVFKDNLLAQAKPELAVKSNGGAMWQDREHLHWVEPFRREVWEYNIQIAVEAAQLGFDEIQFDYVRFPDASAPHYSQANTEENRVKAISGFLQEAKNRLLPYNVFLSADIFGYVCWNLNDTQIGQKLEAVVPTVDYLSPMLYPSGFMYGIPGYRNPVANPHEIVYLTLKRAQERTQIPTTRFRPWLQAFRDYAFDRRFFNAKEIKSQIDAAEKFGSLGWMLWNPLNNYSGDALRKEKPAGLVTSLVIPSKNL